MLDEEQQMQRAVQEDAAFHQRKEDAAVQFACDYGPLLAALDGRADARASMAIRLDVFLKERGLKIVEADQS